MARRNGKHSAGPRMEVKEALRAMPEHRFSVPDVSENIRSLVRQHPFASLAIVALAGFGAGVCIRMITR